jgi:hypothetical protein
MVIVSRARLVLLAAGSAAAFACADPVHDQTVDSLGPETPGVPPGPLHRPGQPCLACHGGDGPASLQFSVGGTVYAVRDQPAPALGPCVQIEDIDGDFWTSAPTNDAGNFFVAETDFAPNFPIRLSLVTCSSGVILQQMQTYAARDGSCADCHSSPKGTTSAGPVYLAAGAIADGGAAP